MDFNFVPITEEHIRSIATWKYEGIYSFYDSDAAPENFFRGLERGRIFAVLDDEGSLAGWYGMCQDKTCSRTGWYESGLAVIRRYVSKATQTPVSITLV